MIRLTAGILSAWMLLFPSLVSAESVKRAAFLNIPLSVRQMGMGGIDAGGADILRAWSNPAVLVEQETCWEAGIGGASRYGNEQQMAGMGVGWRFSPKWAVGGLLSWNSTGAEEILADGSSSGSTIGTTGIAPMLGVAGRVRSVNLGLAGKIVSESVLGDRVTGFGADLGVSGYWSDVYGALSIRNIGPALRPVGTDVPVTEALPVELRASVAYPFEAWNLRVGAQYNNTLGIGGGAAVGAEWWAAPVFGLRAGASGIGSGDDIRFSFGLSGVYRGMGIDYSMRTHPLGLEHTVAVSVAFGPQIEAGQAVGGVRVERAFQGRLQEGRLNVGLGDLEPQNVSKGDASIISDLVRRELLETGKFNVVEKQQMDKIVAEQMFQQYGCTSEECVVKLGRLLNVQAMLIGSFGKLAGKYVVSIRVVDVETGKVVYVDSVTGATVDRLRVALRDLALRLAAALVTEAQGGKAGFDANAVYAEAVASYNAGRYDESLAKSREVVTAAPTHWQAWQMVGNCLYAKGDVAGAQEAYRKSLDLNPDNPGLKAFLDGIGASSGGK